MQVNVSHNRLGVKGGEALAAFLKRNKTLTEIDLSNNEIGTSFELRPVGPSVAAASTAASMAVLARGGSVRRSSTPAGELPSRTKGAAGGVPMEEEQVQGQPFEPVLSKNSKLSTTSPWHGRGKAPRWYAVDGEMHPTSVRKECPDPSLEALAEALKVNSTVTKVRVRSVYSGCSQGLPSPTALCLTLIYSATFFAQHGTSPCIGGCVWPFPSRRVFHLYVNRSTSDPIMWVPLKASSSFPSLRSLASSIFVAFPSRKYETTTSQRWI